MLKFNILKKKKIMETTSQLEKEERYLHVLRMRVDIAERIMVMEDEHMKPLFNREWVKKNILKIGE